MKLSDTACPTDICQNVCHSVAAATGYNVFTKCCSHDANFDGAPGLLLTLDDQYTNFHSNSKPSKPLKCWNNRKRPDQSIGPTFFCTLSSTSSPAVLNSSTASLCVRDCSVIPFIYRMHMTQLCLIKWLDLRAGGS